MVGAPPWELDPCKRRFRDAQGRLWPMSLPWELCKQAGAGCWGAMLCLGGGGSEPSIQAGSEGPCPAQPQLSLSELAGQLGLRGLC